MLNVAAFVVVFVVVLAGLTTLLLKNRADQLGDAKINAGNLASVMAEQVDHAMDALDTSLRTTARLVKRWSPEQFLDRVTRPEFLDGLKSERIDLRQAELVAITNEKGVVIGGSRGDRYTKIDISDRDYFKAIRDDPQRGLVVSQALISRATGQLMIFLARALTASDGSFVGVAFLGVEPKALFETAHPIKMIEGQSFGLFDEKGGLILRRPAPALNADLGRPIDAASPWHRIVAEGGGIYRSEGYFDSDAEYVAVRPLQQYPLIVSVAITERAALAKWRSRSIIMAGATLFALSAIGALFYAQAMLRRRLRLARLRSWMRARRLARQATELANVNDRFGIALDYMAHGMAMFDRDGRVVVSNRCYAELYGLKPELIRPGMRVDKVFDLRIAAGAYAGDLDQYRTFAFAPPPERTDHLRTGRVLLIHSKPTDDGGWVTMQEDITERFEATARLSHIALHDSLTQLPNRAGFKQYVHELATCGARPNGALVVLLVDIDAFKLVNDSFGHDVGDAVLIEVARRLRDATPAGFAARLGGDEFVVSLWRAGDVDSVGASVDSLLRELRRPMNVDGRHISLGFCIGVNIVVDDVFDIVHILRRADLALAEAKGGGRDRYRIFDEAMERRFDQRAELGRELRDAIEFDQLELHYQPIVTASEQRIVCMEALARWRHPTKGLIPPNMFIPLAEETGLILQLGDWVLRRACADAVLWPSDISVAVNVSSLQITQPDFADAVARALEQTGLPPRRLQIEITESVLLQDDRQTAAAFGALHDLGVSFALDDFGTGYASLAYLKTFPLDKLKIDKSFVDDICTDPQSIAIIGSIVTLARGLGIVTTAEGVETRAQLETLAAIGVATIQGYYIGKPRPIAEQDLSAGQTRAA
jgi:diguanylate cyclase (GGDEF)-like protein